MANDQITDYIKSELGEGKSRQDIVDALMRAGWSDGDVRAAFDKISAVISPFPQSASASVTEKEYSIKKLWAVKLFYFFFPLSALVSLTLFFLIPYFLSIAGTAEKDFSLQTLGVVNSGNHQRGSVIIVLGFVFIKLYFLFFNLFGIAGKGDIIFVGVVWFVILQLIIATASVAYIANLHFSIDQNFITLRQGILSRSQRHIPYGAIQNLYVRQDLFDRIFGLAVLMGENASRGVGVFIIPGLAKADAEILRGIILQKMKENPAVDMQSGL